MLGQNYSRPIWICKPLVHLLCYISHPNVYWLWSLSTSLPQAQCSQLALLTSQTHHRTWWCTQLCHPHRCSGCSPSSMTGSPHTQAGRPSHPQHTGAWSTPQHHYDKSTSYSPASSGQCLGRPGTLAHLTPVAFVVPDGEWHRGAWCRHSHH